MEEKLKIRTDLILLALVALDVLLSGTALLFPSFWFRLFHGAAYVDPQALLKRTGAVWVAFTLLQFLALVRWKKQPYWLVLIAGVRLTEIFSDWTYLAFCSSITVSGWIGLLVSPPANLFFAWILIRTWKQVTASERAA
jgi:hypothetical protein